MQVQAFLGTGFLEPGDTLLLGLVLVLAEAEDSLALGLGLGILAVLLIHDAFDGL